MRRFAKFLPPDSAQHDAASAANVAGGGASAKLPGQRRARLLDDIETQIVPRLMLAHRTMPATAPGPLIAASSPTTSDVADFARVALAEDVGGALRYVYAIQRRGVSLEAVYLELLAPTARHLGELWNADLCSFTDVTVGLWRLHQVARELSPSFRQDAAERNEGRRILLTPAPGDQHTFGLCLVSDFFRRAGWNVWAEQDCSASALVAILRSDWFAVLGISVGCASRLEGLASAIHALRRASRNRNLGVMVGGPVFIDHPELAAAVGADATAVDANYACLQAESLAALMATRAQRRGHAEAERQTDRLAKGRFSVS